MIKQINKRETGYDIVVDNGDKLHYDVIFLCDVIGYNDNEVIGTDIEGNVVRIDVRNSDKEYYEAYRYKGKRLEIELCGERCWHESQDEDEEPVYDAVFEYLKTCPQFDMIEELVAYLIEKCIETRPVGEVSEELMQLFYNKNYRHAGEDDYHFNSRFEEVLELAKIVLNQF